MKKAVLLLVIIYIMTEFMLSAIAQTEKEILFRGIPWETDIVTFSTAIADDIARQGVDFMYTIENSAETFVYFQGYTGTGVTRIDHYDPTVPCFDSVFTLDGSFSVAGVHADSMWLYAIPDMQDGLPVEGEQNTDVVLASYSMSLDNYTDKDLVYNGLCEKLRQLYGEPDEAQSYLLFWHGANATFCEIIQHNDGSVEIDYGKTDLPERMKLLLCDASAVDMTDVSGL